MSNRVFVFLSSVWLTGFVFFHFGSIFLVGLVVCMILEMGFGEIFD